jgi:hypothetical protein
MWWLTTNPDPFGYDKNDLVRVGSNSLHHGTHVLPPRLQNLDHFTNFIIRSELDALVAAPPPDVSVWAFSPLNKVARPEGGTTSSEERTLHGEPI